MDLGSGASASPPAAAAAPPSRAAAAVSMERAAATAPTDAHKTCLEHRERACGKSAFVMFMLQHLERIGCPVEVDKHIVCEPCPQHMPINGVFDDGRNEIVLCENNLISERTTADVLTHELIHAYDKCRAKVDFKNPEHLACTEIRAANLSGDCFLWKEFFNRFNFNFQGGHKKCVRRRAARSIVAVTNDDYDAAYAAIDRVWDTCFNDTEPFDEIPW
mmetsp:Transcript_31314/g.82076  ORF Transcript_31314/g.82076 Transcript_31314/m.82076 type:complete len:218 (-) Transcript_31314:40-693(-)|eukprot:CAMPEP_0182928158 /NCGR_PEP_ID=MMETSP0105_2-20130417/15355_1 /TAXON_ID=81532 ORGANISM="Acanthoeca-like sp., Strain 10tr" /NCGR_SAMPLE_ID=MMETSP0105_2 /ASSEMBLY_ACC=CAM_ASM_000205 /LENGTH=217 /DNA_ID=CAMNT_0025066151 /DNA_START=18 /DNA_END=668 /DNA_ORIENTATION=+